MRKQYLAIAISFFIFACGGNAENVSEGKTVETEVVVSEDVSAPAAEEIVSYEEGETIVNNIDETEEKVEEILSEEKETTAPKEEVKEIVTEVVETSEEVVPEPIKIRANHEAWDALTKKYVSSAGKVNYKGMKVDISKIKIYLLHLEKTVPTAEWMKNEKLAYWINLYNASTVYLIATNYPVSSITKINGGKPWDKKFVKSGTNVYTLNDIENKIVRPTFKDPRIHAALNCAAVSCPKLLKGAFLPENLNTQLDKQVRSWINDGAKNKLAGDKIQISQIFDWYKVDFKDGVVSFLNNYNTTNMAVMPDAKISYLEYNWALNE